MRISIYPSLQVHSVTPPAGTSHTLLLVQGVGFSGLLHATPRCIFTAARGDKFRQTSATRLSDTQLRCHSPRDVYGLVPPSWANGASSWANGTSNSHDAAHDGASAHDGVAGGGGDGGGGGLLYVPETQAPG